MIGKSSKLVSMVNNKKKVLIVGATGFIGKNLYAHLKDNTSLELFNPNRIELNLLDSEQCLEYLEKLNPEIVIHSAVDISSTENSLKMFFNIFNGRKFFQKLIQIGSGAEYDGRYYSPKMPETLFGKSIPVDTYGLAKYLIAKELLTHDHKKVLNLRLFGVFGDYENHLRRFISNNICRSLADLPIALNRDMFFDYIHVKDFTRIISRLLDLDNLMHSDYNFCTGKPVLLSEIAQLIQIEMCNKKPILIKNPGRNPEYSGDPSKLFNEIGHFNFTPIDQSIQSMAKFYRQTMTEDQLQLFIKLTNAQ